MKKVFNYLFLLLFVFCLNVSVSALTIVETPFEDEFDTIENNTIVVGITKFEPNVTLTAGKTKTATLNYSNMYPNDNLDIYYYLAGNWFLIDEDNNATVVTDEDLLKQLNNSNIFYINNNEKIIDVDYVSLVDDKHDMVFCMWKRLAWETSGSIS